MWSGTVARTDAIDPVTVSVVQHRLFAIVEEMGEAMLRTAYSQILNSSRDFSTAICDAEGRLLAQAEHVPVHVGAIPFAVRSVADYFAGEINPGDVYLLNDPYHGGNHLPDVTAFVPIFVGDRHAYWTINRAHHSDIGGATHGAYNPGATEIWQEGIRISPIRVHDQGTPRRDIIDMLATNVRHPRDFRGDLAAMIGSAHLGARRLMALIDELGAVDLGAAVEAMLDGAERRARAIYSEWADGEYRGEAVLDDDGHGREDIVIRARVTVAGSDVTVDLSESDAQATGFVNSSHANMQAGVAMALAYLLDPDIPKNSGAFRPVTVKAKPGTVVWAEEGAPVTLCTSHCAQEILEAIMVALAPACPDRAVAGWGRRFRVAVKGKDPRTGRTFIWHLFHARPGGGASPAGDGWNSAGEWHSAGGIKFGSVEVAEARFPLFFKHHEFLADSHGAGRYRGGTGARLDLVLETDGPSQLNTAGEGVRHGARGIQGGADGAPHRYTLEQTDGTLRDLKTKEVGVVADAGAVLHVNAGGGGGWGDPAQRAAAAITADRENGLTLAEAAE